MDNPNKPIQHNGCVCQYCERVYYADLIVPDEVWEQISPKKVEGDKGGGLLCPTCIVERAVQLGIWTAAFADDIDEVYYEEDQGNSGSELQQLDDDLTTPSSDMGVTTKRNGVPRFQKGDLTRP